MNEEVCGEYTRSSRHKKRKRKIRWFRIILTLVMLLFLSVSGFLFYTFKLTSKTIEKINLPIVESALRSENGNLIADGKPISILLMGIDAPTGDVGRADTLILMTINPVTNDTKVVNIPRDTQVELAGYESGPTTKINSAYTHGSEEMTVRTVEQFLNVPVDYYMTTNFAGFTKIIDAVGGINVDNQFAFDADGFHFEEGEISLNGAEALSYSRMRKEDPQGDFGRQARQRQVLNAVKDKAKSPRALFKVDDVMEIVGTDVRTNLDFKDMIGLKRHYLPALDKAEVLDLNPVGKTVSGVSMQIVPDENRDDVSNAMRMHLALD